MRPGVSSHRIKPTEFSEGSPMKFTRGAVDIRIKFLHGRKYLPIITLKHAA